MDTLCLGGEGILGGIRHPQVDLSEEGCDETLEEDYVDYFKRGIKILL